jgi:hypothetical protein
MPVSTNHGKPQANGNFKSTAQLAQEKTKADLAQKQAAIDKASKSTK